MSTVLPATVADPSHLAVAGFLARYREPTASAYRRDLRCFWQWCADRDLSPLTVKRPHIELYLRDLEPRGYAAATISRRLSAIAGLFKYAVIDDLVPTNPTLAVTRPRVPWEGQRRTVLHPLEFAAVLSASRQDGATAHALVPCWGCSGCGSAKPATPRSKTCAKAAGTNCCAYSARAPSPPRFRCRSPSCARSRPPPTAGYAGRSWSRPEELPSAVERPAASWPGSSTPPASPARPAHTGCAGPSAPPD